ncbi:MAG: TIGR04086 family membrane protein [Zhenhengia sp.]|jgi:putative membrane protein (TIGR04086 family)|uniref:TIGR04086 family membrane protein n=1 Tax=Zhenhengia sp. TaxID=2944208 RepID=UPI00290B2B39|nr:TIGR04086 family membrane protein [Clostridiales bacterium]MDU6856012.1 TIGR04086 family membrane protein [Clostridiales bacterium]MDU6975943.1 TIGR04086 family membrane protein [Clostridiales bacterium]
MSRHKKKMNLNIGELAVTLVKSNLAAYALTAIFIIFATLMITYTNLGPNFEKWIILIGTIASAALVGYDTAKQEGKQGYKWGLIGGISYLVIFVILAFVTGGVQGMNIGYLITLIILTIVSSVLAGMFSVANAK